MEGHVQGRMSDRLLSLSDTVINWSRKFSLWPMFFGLSCCFVEEAAAFTSRYDLARFGAEVLRPSPRQSDLLIVSGTVFKKIAPVVLRLYEQMPEPKWVISMGSCANSGGMFDVYSVVQGVDQIIPVDIYVPGCPPRPEALLQGLVLLQEKIVSLEKPARRVFHLGGGSQGTEAPILVDGINKTRDTRGTGYEGVPIRGTAATPRPYNFWGNRADDMWVPPARRIEMTEPDRLVAEAVTARFGETVRLDPRASDMVTFIADQGSIKDLLRFLKTESQTRYKRLDDLTAIDESARRGKVWSSSLSQGFTDIGGGQAERAAREPYPDYTMVYQLLSFDTATRVRVKAGLNGKNPATASVTDIWPSANWYEREVFDLFGIGFEGHPSLRRIIMPEYWEGHPLRKDYPGRATSMPPYTLSDAMLDQPIDARELMKRDREDISGEHEFFLNIGPHHVSTHGLLRCVAELEGEEIRRLDLEIGYHHRAKEKLAEHQTWHQFIPYCDRVDYLAGSNSEMSYLQAVEKLADIKVPDRAQMIRVLVCELYRLSNHLVWFSTFAHDLGAMTPNFYTFVEREQILDVIELITGGRLHPEWFRIGGVANDLPGGWKEAVDNLVRIFPGRLHEYERLIRKNPIFMARTKGIGRISLDQAMDWGITGPNLRACGLEWDLRKKTPYSGYDQLDFEIPTDPGGDCYARYLVRVEEMRQSVRIIKQVAANMPSGSHITDQYRYTVPRREEMLRDIETLINHFINVSTGPKMPHGEAYAASEVPRGEQGYFLVSDGLGYPYRLRIRGPGFANVQALPMMAEGGSIADLIAIVGSMDYILPDIDR